MRVKKAIEAIPGVKSAKADFKKGNVIIKAEDKITTESLVKAVNETGLYEAEQ
jgi:copper chaperone CopZ